MGPGFVPLEAFLRCRLDEDQVAAASHRDELEVAAKRQVLSALGRSKIGTMHRAGLQVAAKAVAGVYVDHPDFDPTWRL